MLANRIVRNG